MSILFLMKNNMFLDVAAEFGKLIAEGICFIHSVVDELRFSVL